MKFSLVENTGDPGAYNPTTNRFAAKSSLEGVMLGFAAATRSTRTGAGSFGGIAPRSPGDWLSIMGEDTPGPGSYGQRPRSAPMPSSAFRSSSAQRPRMIVQGVTT